ncbi:MAG: tyrosine-type recombinase/integrase [Chitinophagales bacterium]
MPQTNFNDLFKKFISDSLNGKRMQKNGKKIKEGTLKNYYYLNRLLVNFQTEKKFNLRLRDSSRLTTRELSAEKNYWKIFYKKFTDYLYTDLGHYDNYVGSNMKMLRTFFNYLNDEKGLRVGSFHKSFYVRNEEIPIVVLSPEQLNFLIYDKSFESRLTIRLERTKDIFVFGCTVALRVSDLINLNGSNLEITEGNSYLKVTSKKTQTLTRIKLPSYAVEIIKKYHRKRHKNLLPVISNYNLNKNLKLLAETAGWTNQVAKIRGRRGISVSLDRTTKIDKGFRFCDLITSHTMRRTAITTMLSLGMTEFMVRKISGHAANSKEFFRYVALAQSYIDKETEVHFQRLSEKKLTHKELGKNA